MVQPRQPTQKSAPKSSSGNVLFAVAVVAVVGGSVFLFMRPGSSQPATPNAAAASAPVAGDPAPANASTVPSAAQDAAPIPTEPPKKRPPANAVMPPINPDGYSMARPADQVQAAYEWAAQHPDIAQYVPCFCGCEHMGHRGNDDCFVRSRDPEGRVTAWEPHGMACEVCLDVANESRRMYASGASVTQIRAAIEQKYRPRAQSMTPTPMPPPKK